MYKCECGNEVEVNINKLHTGHTKSCGCLKYIVKDLIGIRNKKNYWKCKCDCGNYCEVSTASLMNGTTTSCGCKNKENQNNIVNYRNDFIDGTLITAIISNRKMNKNNKSGYRGVYLDKNKKMGS